VVFWHVWTSHPTSTMQLGGDQWRNVWFLGWVPFAIGHGMNPLFSGYANAPGGVNLLTAGGIPLLGLVFAPITELWGPVASYNVVSTSALSFSALGAYSLIRRLTTWRPAAFVGGLLYGFSPAVIAQAGGHVNLSFDVFPPLILLALHAIVVRQGRRRPSLVGVLLGLVIVAQFFVSPELLLDTAVVAIVGLVASVIAGRRLARSRAGYAVRGLVWAVGVAVVLLAWPVWFMLAGTAHVSGKLDLVPQAYRADLLGTVLPDSNQLLTVHGSLLSTADHFASSVGENGSYLGVLLVIVLLGGVVALRRNRSVLVAAFVGAVAVLLSLGGSLVVTGMPEIGPAGTAAGRTPLPEAVFSRLPVLDNVEPARFSLLVDLLVAIVLAFVLEALHHGLISETAHGPKRTNRRQWAAGLLPGIVAVIALVALIPAVPFGNIGPAGTPAFFTMAALRILPQGATALVFPFPSGTFPATSLWQAAAGFWFKMPGGDFLVPQGPSQEVAYSTLLRYAPDSLTARTLTLVAEGNPPAETPTLRDSIRAQLGQWGVRSVIAVPAASQAPGLSIGFLRWLLGPPSSNVDGSVIWLGWAHRKIQ